MWLPQIFYQISGQFCCSYLSYLGKTYFGIGHWFSFSFSYFAQEYPGNGFKAVQIYVVLKFVFHSFTSGIVGYKFGVLVQSERCSFQIP